MLLLAQNLGAGASYQIDVPAVLGVASYVLSAVADPAGTVEELSESNNAAQTQVQVYSVGTSLADLALDAEALTHMPLTPTTLDVITVSTVLRNLGNAVATGPGDIGTGVNLYDGDPASGGEVVGSQYVGSVPPGAEIPVLLTTRLPEGRHNLYLVADSRHVVPELEETINSLSLQVDVRPPLPDLTVSMDDVSFSPPS